MVSTQRWSPCHIWNETFIKTPITDIRIIVDNRNNRNATKELVCKRPPMSATYEDDKDKPN
jgi:hypothetical protein